MSKVTHLVFLWAWDFNLFDSTLSPFNLRAFQKWFQASLIPIDCLSVSQVLCLGLQTHR